MFSLQPSRRALSSLVAVLGAVALCGCGGGALQAAARGFQVGSGNLESSQAALTPSDPVNPFPDDPLHGVKSAKATGLQIQTPWTTFVGTVASYASGTAKDGNQKDGDWQINVLPDPQYRSMINSYNVTANDGDMVVEVVPEDQGTVQLPSIGAHIQVWGPQVIDTHHGWEEIHPVRYLYLVGTSLEP